jgi:hypothetical protein
MYCHENRGNCHLSSLKGNFVSKKIGISETDLEFHLDYKMENSREGAERER